MSSDKAISQIVESGKTSVKSQVKSQAKSQDPEPKTLHFCEFVGKRSPLAGDVNIEDELEGIEGEQFDNIQQLFDAFIPTPVGGLDNYSARLDLQHYEPVNVNVFDDKIDTTVHEMQSAALREYMQAPKAANQSSIIGYHMIFSVLSLTKWIKAIQSNDYNMPGQWSSNSICLTKNLDTLSSSGFWPAAINAISHMPSFLSYICSDSFRECVSTELQALREKVTEKKQKDELTAKIPKAPFINREATFLWSLEGVTKALEFNDIKYLHFHVIIKYSMTISTARMWAVVGAITNYLPGFKMSPGSMTVTPLRSAFQIRYIFKEGVFSAHSVVYGRAGQSKFGHSHNRDSYSNLLWVDGGSDCYSCVLCSRWKPEDTYVLCGELGWNVDAISRVMSIGNEALVKFFTNTAGIAKYFESHSSDKAFCTERVHKGSKFRFTQFFRACYGLGLQTNLSKKLFDKMANLMDEYIAADRILKIVQIWIYRNIVGAGTYRVNLAIGGPGGNGKTTLAKQLFAGLGQPYERTEFKPTQIGRAKHSAVSMMTFYDEAPVGVKDAAKDIFMNFTALEAAGSRLYQANMNHKAVEFNMIASAKINGLPSFKDYQRLYGVSGHDQEGDPEKSYQVWKAQTERRFVCIDLWNKDSFLLPMCQFLDSSYAYVSGQEVACPATPSILQR